MSFGARVLKTGIAVTLALYVSMLLGIDQSPVGAAIAAIFAMQPSIYRSWRYFLDQLQSTTLGAIVALVGGMIFSNEPIAVGAACILVISICLKLNMGDTIGLTLVTVVSIMEASGDWNYALNRFLLTLVGIICASVINVTVSPPKPKIQFVMQIRSVFDRMSLLLRTSISDEIKESVFRDEKNDLEGQIKSLVDKYRLFEEETQKLRRAKFSTTRQMVVYKLMLSSLQKGYAVLDAVDRHYFQSERTEKTDEYFDNHLEKLIKFHEHVLLKFEDKLKPNDHEGEEIVRTNVEFMESAIERIDFDREGMLRLSIVAAAMYDYGYQLERLNRLADHILDSEETKDNSDGLSAWLKK
ncbi:aromatic acid exporter family protein [Paenibacillus polygoni]|uniref:Aromatic acid exporter family protein n=1 Tax=Paenibacillus polygoni TaxID=3050112 RepID=A0ABY8X9Q9_9BACL|nr:aromatic acid exporter family protein [Paenibacillus polygoni]WIV20694.1 aromatic acid exporter family protein [Paenibacillus polygoni]